MTKKKEPIYDEAFLSRIRQETDTTGKAMIMTVYNFVHRKLTRAQFFKEMNAHADKLEQIQDEEKGMLDTFARIIADMERLGL